MTRAGITPHGRMSRLIPGLRVRGLCVPGLRVPGLCMALLFAMPVAAAPAPMDCNDADATRCVRAALQAAMPAERVPYFAGMAGAPGVTYRISDTLVIESVYGGTIDGNGAVLEWHGPPDRPMFLLRNTQQLKITNLRIVAVQPLQAAFEFTKAPYGKDPARNVAPSLNILDAVRIEGVKLGNLRFGVRFSQKYGIDEDNDQSTIINTAIYNVTEAAISIEHPQSQHHHFYAVKATGAEGNRDAAFVRASGGSFSSLGGFHGRFGGAVYDLAAVYGTDLIVDENSEASARLIRTPDGMASFPMPVQVVGGRFAVDRMAPDGRIVDFNRMGPLTITGLKISGESRPGDVSPVISFRPQPVDSAGVGHLYLTGMSFDVPGSADWELIKVSPAARVTADSASCVDSSRRVTRCRGLAAGVRALDGMSFGDLAAGPGKGLAPGHSTYCADCAVESGSGRCAGGGDGQFARKLPGGWYCD